MENRDTGTRRNSDSNSMKTTLNRLGEAWSAVKDTDETKRKYELETAIFKCAESLFKKGGIWENAAAEFYINDWKLFDASRGGLYDFMNDRLKKRAQNVLNKEMGVRRVKRTRRELEDKAREQARRGGGEPIRKDKYVRTESLDAPLEGEEDLTLADMYQDTRDDYAPHQAVVNRDWTMSILTAMLRFQEHLHGRADNQDKRNYYRMFYTDNMVDYIHTNGSELINREREMFETMKLGFLDFFMKNTCRTAEQIQDSPLKAWGEMVPGRPMTGEPKQPLPNDVYKTYLSEREGKSLKSESAITNQRTAYQAFMREILRRENLN